MMARAASKVSRVSTGRGRLIGSIGCVFLLASALGPQAIGAVEERPILHLYGGDPKGEICLIDGDGENRTCLTDNRRFDYDPVWAPDGSRIAFTQQTNEPRNPDIYLMDPSGGNKQRLTRSPFDDDEPQWSPDGQRIVWNRNRGDSPTGRLMIMNSDGSDKRPLAGPGRDDVDARWSPSGSEVMFASRDACIATACVNHQLDLHVIGADGTNERKLTQTDADEFQAAWSPDGSRLAFVRTIEGDDAEIFVMDADGGGETKLTDTAGSNYLPAWSPDGSQIAFMQVSDPDNFETRLGVVDVATGAVQVLTDEEVGGVAPEWSPDGEFIAFVGHRALGITASYELHTIRPDGSDLTRLTRTTGDEAELDWSSY